MKFLLIIAVKKCLGILVIDKTKGVPPLVLYPSPINAYKQGRQLTESRKPHGDRQLAFKASLNHVDKHLDSLFNCIKENKDWIEVHKTISKIVNFID